MIAGLLIMCVAMSEQAPPPEASATVVVRRGSHISTRRFDGASVPESPAKAPTALEVLDGSVVQGTFAPAAMPVKAHEPAWWRMWAAVTGLALAGVVAGILRRRRAVDVDNSEISVLASKRFGAKHRVEVVNIDGQRLLLSVGPEGVRLLCGLRTGPDFASQLAASSNTPAANSSPVGSSGAAADVSSEVSGILQLKQARAARHTRN